MERKRTLAWALFVTIAILLSACGKKEQASAPPAVEVVTVVQKDVPITREWVATLDGYVNAQIRAQVAGLLLKQTYTNGAYVKKGTPLLEIDPRPFQAALDQAKSELEQAKANLQRAQAQLDKTKLDVARYTPLAKESAISQQELDDAIQANLASKAQVEQEKAGIEAARAKMESARLNLTFTQIVSPIDGIAAIATAQVGDFVNPQTGSLTTVSTVDPILATITPSEQEYLKSVQELTRRRVGNTSLRDEESLLRTLEFQLKLTDGSIFAHKGTFYAINRQIDVKTGAIQVQIKFPNPGNVLRPGGFGSVSTVTRIQQGALLVPQRAVTELQGGYMVALIDHDNKAALRPVKMGEKVGGWWVVEDGLKPGDRVVAEGTQQVQEGMRVTPKPYQESASAEKTAKGSGT
jgi:membrane fusion protein (multidrug efflux system)